MAERTLGVVLFPGFEVFEYDRVDAPSTRRGGEAEREIRGCIGR
jgi:hypothetical protein